MECGTHIALVCGPFFGMVEGHSQYEARRQSVGRGVWPHRCLRAVTTVLPVVPKEPTSGTGRPSHQKPIGHTASTAVVVENGLYLRPCGAGHHMTPPAPGVGSCLHHLSHRIRKCQRGLSPHAWPPRMLWRSPSLHHCHGKTGCERRKMNKRGTPLLEGDSPALSISPHVWRAVASVTF